MTPSAETTSQRNASPSGTPRPSDAIADMYQKHAGKLLGWVTANCGFRNDAEDICQEIWLKVVRFLPSFDPSTNFFSWLLTIANNVIIDFHRRRKVIGRNPDGFAEDYDPKDPRAVRPDDIAMHDEQTQILAQCVTKLPERQRDLFKCLMAGGTVPSCAEKLDMPTSSAYLEQKKAIASLGLCVERNPS